eukprot:7494651-Lingulodinium_polyedra.AAC.1
MTTFSRLFVLLAPAAPRWLSCATLYIVPAPPSDKHGNIPLEPPQGDCAPVQLSASPSHSPHHILVHEAV